MESLEPMPECILVAQAMIKLPKISIAAVNGMAIGGGVNLALVWQDFVPRPNHGARPRGSLWGSHEAIGHRMWAGLSFPLLARYMPARPAGTSMSLRSDCHTAGSSFVSRKPAASGL